MPKFDVRTRGEESGRSGRAVVHHIQGYLLKAKNDYDKSLEIYPNQYEALVNRAQLHIANENCFQVNSDTSFLLKHHIGSKAAKHREQKGTLEKQLKVLTDEIEHMIYQMSKFRQRRFWGVKVACRDFVSVAQTLPCTAARTFPRSGSTSTSSPRLALSMPRKPYGPS